MTTDSITSHPTDGQKKQARQVVEEVESGYGYFSGYKPQSVANQMAILKKTFPSLESFEMANSTRELLPSAEGIFLIPRWEKIAPAYNQAVKIVLAKLAEVRNGAFYNSREFELGPKLLRQSKKKMEGFQKLGDQQKGHDVLVVQAQLGLNHRGRSVRRARAVMSGNEFGLGAFEAGIVLLAHPNRLKSCNDLWIDCAGDEYSPDADGAPCFLFGGDIVNFDARHAAEVHANCGSASAVLPSE